MTRCITVPLVFCALAEMASAADVVLQPGEVRMRVAAPVADVRSDPKTADGTYAHDPLQETQLLFGEPVVVLEVVGEWARVIAPDQREFTHHQKWEGYPGWVRLSDLDKAPLGTILRVGVVHRIWAPIYSTPPAAAPPIAVIPGGSRVHVIGESREYLEIVYRERQRGHIRRSDVRFFSEPPSAFETRIAVWKNVRRFLGTPYYWGGLSPGVEIPFSLAGKTAATLGVDCSGLTHLSYRLAGIDIPRDSHEQWMVSEKIRRADLQRGDLVFLANSTKPDRVVHVMMYAGGEFLIEGPGTGLEVRRVTFKKKLGKRMEDLESGDRVGEKGEKIVYFGRMPR